MSTLDVVRAHSRELRIVALAAGRNWRRLEEQIREFRPKLAVMFHEEEAERLRKAVADIDVQILDGMDGLMEASGLGAAQTVVSALVGAIGLRPILEAIRMRKKICLANKEPLVMAGKIVMDAAEEFGTKIVPIDSEHSAIYQCLEGRRPEHIGRLILTASGGPFRNIPADELAKVTVEQALAHPNWKMGGKISIDSATMMNKGLEVIEAACLFHIPADRVDVVVHPQSIIHSMIEFIDGSMLAQMGVTDMKLPIQYALSTPDRWCSCAKQLDLTRIGTLTFETPRFDDFPCLKYAYHAAKIGGNMPCSMNAGNEIAVSAFLDGKISFAEIPQIIQKVMDETAVIHSPSLQMLFDTDSKARIAAETCVKNLAKGN